MQRLTTNVFLFKKKRELRVEVKLTVSRVSAI